MNQRSLRYTDGKSDKFWTIVLDACSHRVQYGRTGTAGQTQTKEFPTEAAAQKSYEKLVAEKLKKGYVEETAIERTELAAIAPTQQSKPKSTSTQTSSQISKSRLTETTPVEISENWRSMAWMEIQRELVQDEKPLCELAAIDAIPEDCWEVLNVKVKTAIANKPFNPPQVYQKLAADSHEAVRKAVASNLYMPSELLSRLSHDSVEEVRLSVAKNSSAPRAVVDHLVQDAYQKVRKAALANQAEYDLALKLISNYQARHNESSAEVRPIESLDHLEVDQLLTVSGGYDHDLIWYEMEYNSKDYHLYSFTPNSSESMLLQMQVDRMIQPDLMKNAISYQAILRRFVSLDLTAHQSAEQLEKLYQDLNSSSPLECEEYRLLISIAYNPNTPIAVLAELIDFQQTQKFRANHQQFSRNLVLEAVALNPSTPKDLMVKLAEKNDLLLAVALAFNKKTPSNILEIIENSENLITFIEDTGPAWTFDKDYKQYSELFYLALAHHPNTPLKTLDQIIHRKLKVSSDEKTPISILKYEDRWIRSRFAPAQVAVHNYQKRHDLPSHAAISKIDKKSPTLSRYIQHLITHQPMLAKSMPWVDRYAITQNSHTPNDLLETLAQDEHPFVQAAARSSLGLEIVASTAIVIIPEPNVEESKIVETIPVELKIERSLNLNPEDYFWVNAQNPNFQPQTVVAMDVNSSPLDWSELVNAQSLQDVALVFFKYRQQSNEFNFSLLKTVLATDNRFSTLDVILQICQQHPDYVVDYYYLMTEFKEHIYFDLRPEEREIIRQKLQPLLQSSSPPIAYCKLAAYLGMAEDVQSIVNTWQPDHNHKLTPTGYIDSRAALEIILGSGYAKQIIQNMRRLNFCIQYEHMKAWLAATEYQGLDILCKNIHDEKGAAILGLAKAPEVAPYMLELWLSLKKPTIARQWLEENVDHAIVGLIPVIADTWTTPVRVKLGALKKAAIDFFVSLQRKGYTALINAALKQETPEIAEKVRSHIAATVTPDYPTFDQTTTPEWLTSGIRNLSSSKQSKSPTWVSCTDLPFLMVDDRAFTDEQVTTILITLSLSTLDSPLPLIHDLKTHTNSSSLDDFIWSLFERWLTEGAPSKEKWAMGALGLLGSDAIALKLTPLIRNWPLENQHARAVLGLECLRKIGTDTALMQINGIAQKIKFPGLKRRAQECMEAIAQDRKMTRAELEDRIVPDCELDDRGSRIFDFGPRQFKFVLSPELKPMLKDAENQVKSDLPKPNTKDDPEKAAAAIADWKLMKKQISEVVKLQPSRLEQAMIMGRRWTLDEFELFLVKHPLMTHLVQRLIWCGYDASGDRRTTFRVTEDQTYADSEDKALALTEVAQVSIIHRLNLTSELQSSWGEILSDYEIIQPFPQLTRDTYLLTEAEQNRTEIVRFASFPIPGITLVRMMEKQGWLKGDLHDHGDYRVHVKYFPHADLTAIVGDYQHQFVTQGIDDEDDEMDGCIFMKGQPEDTYEYRNFSPDCIPLCEIDPVILSEVIRDLSAIVNTTEID